MRNILNTCIFFILLLVTQGMNAQHETWPVPFSFEGKWGVVDDKRQELIEPTFEKIAFFWHSRSIMESALAWQDGSVGLINRKGEWIIAPKMDSIHYATYNNSFLYRVVKNGRWGLVDAEGKAKWLLKPKYESISILEGQKERLGIVSGRKGKGVVNTDGELIVPCKYSKVDITYSYTDTPIIEVKEKNGETTYRDFNVVQKKLAELKEGIEDEYDVAFEDMEVEEMPPSMAPSIRYETGINGETIIIYKADYRKERVVVPAGYTVEKVKTTNHFIPQIQYILLAKDSKLGIMNPAGEIITPIKFDKIEWDKNEYHALLHLNDKVGFTNHNGKQIIPAVFTSITRYNSWYYKLVHPSGYVGFSNSKGQIFLPDYVKLEEE